MFVLTLFLGFHPYSWGMIAPVRPGGAAHICGPIQPAASLRLCLAVGGSLEVVGVSQMRRTSIALPGRISPRLIKRLRSAGFVFEALTLQFGDLSL